VSHGPVLSLPRTKLEARLHAHGKPLSWPAIDPGQAVFPGFGATYREALTDVERAFYVTRKASVGERPPAGTALGVLEGSVGPGPQGLGRHETVEDSLGQGEAGR
jgi:hypothetical protein